MVMQFTNLINIGKMVANIKLYFFQSVMMSKLHFVVNYVPEFLLQDGLFMCLPMKNPSFVNQHHGPNLLKSIDYLMLYPSTWLLLFSTPSGTGGRRSTILAYKWLSTATIAIPLNFVIICNSFRDQLAKCSKWCLQRQMTYHNQICHSDAKQDSL